MTNETLPPALAGQVERGVRPHAEVLARRLQAAAYSHGYEDASPANATTRQAKTDAVSRQTLADLLIAIGALANQAKPDSALLRPVAQIMAEYDGGEFGRCIEPLKGWKSLKIGTALYASPPIYSAEQAQIEAPLRAEIERLRDVMRSIDLAAGRHSVNASSKAMEEELLRIGRQARAVLGPNARLTCPQGRERKDDER